MLWIRGTKSRLLVGGAAALAILGVALPAAAQAQDSAARSRDAWQRTAQRGPAPGKPVAVDPTDFTSFNLDRTALAAAAQQAPAVLSIPKPDGSFARFAVTPGTTLSPELAAHYPDIRDYVGRGIDDPTASLSLVISPEGAYAAIRGSDGTSYVEPRYRDDPTTHVAFARDALPNPPPFHEDEAVAQQLESSLPPSAARPGPGDAVPLRTYRLALINDPSYATFFGGSDAAVLAAKTVLMARVNQIYLQDLGITMQLVPGTRPGTAALNLNTDAMAIQPNGPCGGAACYTAAQLAGCDETGNRTLSQTTIVLGQIAGARNYDIGHLMLGRAGGGQADAGVGDLLKAQGCTGSITPTGDAWGVDFVAHEIGHQFSASHTFNGTRNNCNAENRVNDTAVEPGSGSTIMAYGGICDEDNLQPHSDPYFSQASQNQIYGWVDAPGDDRERPPLSSVQRVSLMNFSGADSFAISSGGGQPQTITNGNNYTLDGIRDAIEAALGPNRTVTVTNWLNTDGALDQTGFTVTYDSRVDEPQLAVSSFTGGASGFVGDAVVGGTRRNGGTVSATSNRAPTVSTAPGFTIPARTPFTLTATGSDPNPGDTLTYLWEENDPGTGRTFGNEPGATGPLFRVFGVAQRTDTGEVYNSTPKNAATTSPARDFPDVAQVMADNTDAVNDCGPVTTDAGNDCWSEYLPKVNRTMNFRVTARDGNPQAGGNGFADTVLTVNGASGPFRLTSQATDTDNGSALTLPVTWDVAGTNATPINTANVRILLSTDDGATFNTVLAPSTPNDGNEAVPLPAGVQTTTGRIRIEGVGNVFYDVSRGRLSFDRTKPPPPSGGGGGTGGGGTSGGGTTTTTTTPPTAAPPLVPVTPSTGNVTMRLKKARTQNFLRAGAVTVTVTTDRDAALAAAGSIAIGGKAVAGARLKLKPAKGQATAGRPTTLKLKLTARDKGKLRAAVRAKRRATASIAVAATPVGGSTTTTTTTSVRQKGR